MLPTSETEGSLSGIASFCRLFRRHFSLRASARTLRICEQKLGNQCIHRLAAFARARRHYGILTPIAFGARRHKHRFESDDVVQSAQETFLPEQIDGPSADR